MFQSLKYQQSVLKASNTRKYKSKLIHNIPGLTRPSMQQSCDRSCERSIVSGSCYCCLRAVIDRSTKHELTGGTNRR